MLCSLPQRLLSPFSCLSQYFSLSLHFSAEGHLCRARGASAGATAKHSHALRSLGAGRSSRDPTMSCPRDRELPKGFPSPELFSLEHPQELAQLMSGTMYMWVLGGPGPLQRDTNIQHEEPQELRCRQDPSPTPSGTLARALAGPSTAAPSALPVPAPEGIVLEQRPVQHGKHDLSLS